MAEKQNIFHVAYVGNYPDPTKGRYVEIRLFRAPSAQDAGRVAMRAAQRIQAKLDLLDLEVNVKPIDNEELRAAMGIFAPIDKRKLAVAKAEFDSWWNEKIKALSAP